MKHWIILLLYVYRGCSASQCWTYDYYDVTYLPQQIDSQPGFDYPDSEYRRNQSRCMRITTIAMDHVIKLEEVSFQLESSYHCSADYLAVYDSPDLSDEIGRYCGSSGPGTVYSTDSHMLLHFVTDNRFEYRGFRLVASSINKNEVPTQVSTAAALGITTAVLIVFIVLLTVLFTYLPRKCHEQQQRSNSSSTSGAASTNSSRHFTTTPRHPRSNPIRSQRGFSNPNYITTHRERMGRGIGVRNVPPMQTPRRPVMIRVAVVSTPSCPQGPPSYAEATTNNGCPNPALGNNSPNNLQQEGATGIANPCYEDRPPPPSYEDVLENDRISVSQSEAGLQHQGDTSGQSASTLQSEGADRN